MRIGIFGGCFNPPHQMHKAIAVNLIKNNYLDKVIYVPTGDIYKKQDLILFKDRYNMVRLMISNNKDLLISDIGNNENYQYTYQVLDYYKNIYKDDDIYFICGSDNLKELDCWMEYEYILSNFKILVIGRNNDDIDDIIYKYYKWKDNIIIANVELNYISSTQIRNHLKELGTTNITKDIIDKKVLEYIISKNLYI